MSNNNNFYDKLNNHRKSSLNYYDNNYPKRDNFQRNKNRNN